MASPLPKGGKPVALSTDFTLRDVGELAIGGCIMAGPIAVTEEVWTISTELTLTRTLIIALATICVIAFMVWSLIYHKAEPEDRVHFRRRVLVAYGLALLISAAMLLVIDRLPVTTEPLVALKRTILVALPVSLGGTAVDDFMSRN